MTKFRVYANGTFWGVFDAGTEAEAMQAAADEHGTADVGADHASTEGMTAKPDSQPYLDAAAVLMDDEIREDMHGNFAPGFDDPDAFLAEYKRRHLAKFGKEFSA